MINELTGLSVDGLNRALASRQISIRYDFRLLDELGAAWSLNGGAVLSRSRSFDLDKGTWTLNLTLLKARIPAGLTVSQYQQVQVDRGIGGGLWAYFRGVIQEVKESVTRRGGSIVEVLEVSCEGVLSKLRGNYVPRRFISPGLITRFHPLIGIARTIQYKHPATSVTASTVWQLSGESHMYLRETGGSAAHDTSIATAVQVASDANFATLYTSGGGSADYHTVTNEFPYEIHWKKAIPASGTANFYVRYRVVDRWIVPKIRPTNLATGVSTQTISLPAGFYLASMTAPSVSSTMTLSGGPTGTYYTTQVAAFNLTATTSVTFTMSGTITTFEVINARGREPYFLCNRRDPQNLLPTTIAAVNVGSRFITPTDAASYITGVSDLGGTEPGLPASGWSNKEYLTVTFSDGNERTVEITAINRTTGQMTVDVFPTNPVGGANAGAGDRIRVSTLEAVQAFGGRKPAVVGELTSAATSINGLRPQCAGAYYQIGQVIPFTGHRTSSSTDQYWLSTSHLLLNRDTRDYDAWNNNDIGVYTVEAKNDTLNGEAVNNNVETWIAIATSKQFVDGPFDYVNDWIIDNTGIVSKERTASSIYMDELVKEWMASSFPPNVLLRDRVDGKIKIGPVAQAAAPSYVLPGVAQVKVEDRAERITNMTVISVNDTDDPTDIASIAFGGVTAVGGVKTWANPERAFDGDDTTKSNPVDFGGTTESFLNTMWFTIPPSNPVEVYPIIERITIAGQGLIIGVFASSGTEPLQTLTQSDLVYSWTLLPSADWIALQNNQPFTIEKKDLERMIRPDRYSHIAISVRQVTDTTTSMSTYSNAGISKIEILQRDTNAHTATMTDNSNLASNATLNAAGFGTTWAQPDGNLNMSFRYAPTAWMKRNSATYGQVTNQIVVTGRGSGYTSRPTVSLSDGTNTDTATAEVVGGRVTRIFTSGSVNRGFTSIPTVSFSGGSPTTAATAQAHIARGRTKIIRLGNMPQAECRTYAENYMDEYLRSHLVYTVEAPLLDYAEPGDTVLVQLPDGSQKVLLLWGITDSGGPGDNMATYTLRDYSL
jgi:hypothetical protein